MGMKVPDGSSRDYSFQQWVNDSMVFGGNQYMLTPGAGVLGSTQTIGDGFEAYVSSAYKTNGVVFACELARLSLFTEARFQYRQFGRDGRPGNLFGDASLIPLHRPWPGGTTGDLLAVMLLDADFAGNAFTHRRGDRLIRLRPDWVTMVFGIPGGNEPTDFTPWDMEAQVVAYLYQEGGPREGKTPQVLMPETVAHFMPLPDPLAPRRGMPWLTPVLREIMSDSAATVHKQAFFENGATVNLAVTYDPAVTVEVFNLLVEKFGENHEGAQNAYKTLHLLGGTPTPIGANLQQVDFKSVQGAGETRIAAAAGVHPTIVGLSEGLQGSSLNAGNFSAARRLVADKTLRPLWRNVCASLEPLVNAPSNGELWYDDRDVAFLREDAKERAETQQLDAQTMRTLIDAGYEPKTVVDAVTSGDYAKLKHTGLFSVQLQPPMPEGPPALPAPTNGNAPVETLTQQG